MSEHIPGHTSGSEDRPPRDVDPAVQLTHLRDLAGQIAQERERHESDHTAYTVRKAPRLRHVLLSLKAGGTVPEHRAGGEVGIQVLSGQVSIQVQGKKYDLLPGDLLNLAPGLVHDVHSSTESSLLLTIAPEE